MKSSPDADGISNMAEVVTGEVMDLLYEQVGRIFDSFSPQSLGGEIASRAALPHLTQEARRVVADVISHQIDRIWELWREQWKRGWVWDNIYDELHVMRVLNPPEAIDPDDRATAWVPMPSPECVRSVVACMNERGFNCFGAAEAWLRKNGYSGYLTEGAVEHAEAVIGGGHAPH